MGLVVWAIGIHAVPASNKPLLVVLCRSLAEGLRWEGDSSSNTSSTLLGGKSESIIASARSTAEGALCNVGFAAMAELLLSTLGCSKHCVTDDHTETLGLFLD